MNSIKIKCQSCGSVHEVPRTPEIPDNATSMGCNWCPECMDSATAYYQEWNIFEGPRRKRESQILSMRFQQFKITFNGDTKENPQIQT